MIPVTVAGHDADRPRISGRCGISGSRSCGRSGRHRRLQHQFAVDPKDGRLIVIEMNPRVSPRSSALASKATGFPIAKIAAKWPSVTPRRDRQRHHQGDAGLFRTHPDYVAVKAPRFAFEKFPGGSDTDHHHEVGR